MMSSSKSKKTCNICGKNVFDLKSHYDNLGSKKCKLLRMQLSNQTISSSSRRSPSPPLIIRRIPSPSRRSPLTLRRSVSPSRRSPLTLRIPSPPLNIRRTPSPSRRSPLNIRRTPSPSRRSPLNIRRTPSPSRRSPLTIRRTPSPSRRSKSPLSLRIKPHKNCPICNKLVLDIKQHQKSKKCQKMNNSSGIQINNHQSSPLRIRHQSPIRINNQSGEIFSNISQIKTNTKLSNFIKPSNESCSEDCVICQESQDESSVMLKDCEHCFHMDCIKQWWDINPKCPYCNKNYGIASGDMPPGKMSAKLTDEKVSGSKYKTIVITYNFNGGKKNGISYPSELRTCYLEASPEGYEILSLLRKSFENGLTFAIGNSMTTGRENVIVWNGIHHKTSRTGGPTNHGFPDPGYYNRVREELRNKGIF